MYPQKSILYLFLIVLAYILVGWFVVLAPYSKVSTFITKLPELINSNVITLYPQNLAIKVAQGNVSINQKTPYCLPLDFKDTSTTFNTQPELPSGIVFDPKAVPDLSALSETSVYSKLCTPVALVGQNFVIYPDKNNTYKYTKIASDLNLDITRDSIAKFINQYLPVFVSFGQKLYFIAPFFAVPFVFLSFLFANLWYGLVVYLVNLMFKIRAGASFGDAYKLSLFFFNFILLAQWILVDLVLNYWQKIDISLNFGFRNTIIIAIASIIYLHTTTPKLVIASHPAKPKD